ncbi:MAG: membrane integrity-associated transporter subunit PqiC [Desulfatirhabdiaceae bacterium]
MSIFFCRLKNTLFCCLILAVLSGCSFKSHPAQYHTLSSIDRPEGQPSVQSGFTVMIGPVLLPETLRRPQIAVRTGDTGIAFLEFDKWAGSLRDDTQRVMVENMSILLNKTGGIVISDDMPVEPDYRIWVSITRFDGTLNDSVQLNAVWTLKDQKNRQVISMNPFFVQQAVTADGVSGIVAAHSRAIEALCRVMADTIMALR